MYASIKQFDNRKIDVEKDDNAINIFCGSIYVSLERQEAELLLKQLMEAIYGRRD